MNDVDGQMSICIDGQWGSGKTFFVKQTKMVLDSLNDVSKNIAEDSKKEIQNIFTSDQKEDAEKKYKPQFTVYYDAWENDNDCDPLLSIIYEIVRAADCLGPVTYNTSFVDMALEIVEMVGVNIKNLIKQIKPTDITGEIKKHKSISEAIHEFLDTVIQERGDRLVIFIDELDRCKPSFAVSLLERIKHYFKNENVTFVFSINSIELTKTIKKFYGSEFNAQNYLDRFFDFPVKLPEIDMELYYRYMSHFLNINGNAMDAVIHFVIKYLDLTLRATANYFNMIDISGLKKVYENYMNSHYHTDELAAGRLFCIGFFAPIMIGLYSFDRKQYEDFISGKNNNLLFDALKHTDSAGDYYLTRLLNDDESYFDEPNKNKVTEEEKVAELCKTVFSDEPSGGFKTIGKLRFRDNIKKELFYITNTLK